MRRIRSAFALLCFIALMQPLQAFSQAQPPVAPPVPRWDGAGPGWMWGNGYGWSYWWICPLMMLFMFVVLAAIFFIVRRSGSDGSHHWEAPWRASSQPALQILSERFAKGEIQRAEYEEKKAAILSGGQR